LATMLSGWDIDILTEAEESERRQEEFRTRSKIFMEALDIDDVMAHLLVAEGFSSVEEIAYTGLEELTQIEGFVDEIAEELQNRALVYTEAERERLSGRRLELGVTDELAEMAGLTANMVVTLGENDIKTVDDLGDLASDELIEMLPGVEMAMEEANVIIMAARAHWFDDEETPEGAEEATDGDAAKDDAAGQPAGEAG
jgi:transcription termination/antitermination protein NusA